MKTLIQTIKQLFISLPAFFKKLSIERSTLLLITIIFLSMADALLTLFWIKMGLAVEANPILSEMLQYGDYWFLGSKIGLTCFGCAILYMTRRKTFTIRAIKVILFLYTLLIGYHIFGILASSDFSLEQLQCIFAEFRTLFLSF